MDGKYTEKLTYTMRKRRKKLIKLRRFLSLYKVTGCSGAALMGYPFLYFLLSHRQSLTVASVESEGGTIDPLLIMIIIMVVLGITLILFSTNQYKYYKGKYDTLRYTTISAMLAEPVCTCYWQPCMCRDDLVEELDKKYDINLNY